MKLLSMVVGLTMAGSAMAQTVYVEVNQDDLAVPELNLQVSQIEDLDVYDESGTLIGDVEDVLGPNAQTPTAVAVDVDKYLGVSGDDVVFTFQQVKLQDGKLVTSIVKDDIAKLPRFND
jgi:rRNA processing protein Gar1